MPVGRGTFDVEPLGLSGCCDVRASARICASSLSDNPTGTGVTGGEIGGRIGGKEDRWRRAIVSAPGSSVTNSCCSIVIPEFRAVSETFRSKGVTIILGAAWMESVERDKIDLGLLHLRFHPR
jgi:hypothetical protein